jgi:hypothetical protein
VTAPNWNGRADDTGALSWSLVGECALILGFLVLVVLA